MKETIYYAADPDGIPITGEIDRTNFEAGPTICLESGCNEFWLNADEARAVAAYLQRAIPEMGR